MLSAFIPSVIPLILLCFFPCLEAAGVFPETKKSYSSLVRDPLWKESVEAATELKQTVRSF